MKLFVQLCFYRQFNERCHLTFFVCPVFSLKRQHCVMSQIFLKLPNADPALQSKVSLYVLHYINYEVLSAYKMEVHL